MIGVISVLFLFGCDTANTGSSQAAEPGKVKIGVMLPLTGDAASYGTGIQRGIELAIADAKLTNVDVIFEDSKCDGKEAVTAINKLISVDKVVAIVGEVCSSATLAAAPIANQHSVPLISPSSTSPAITEAGDYVYRTVPSDALQGDFGANLVYGYGYEKLAVLYSNEDYGIGFLGVLEEIFPSLGGEIVAAEAMERGSADARAQLTKIKEAEPDSIYIISNSPDSMVASIRQIAELGIEADLFGSEGLKGPEVAALDASEGLIITSVSSGTTEFQTEHEARYGEVPGPFAAQGYDAFKALSLAVKQGATSGPQIKQFLDSMEFTGASGKIVFDGSGDVSGNYDVYTVIDNEFILEDE